MDILIQELELALENRLFAIALNIALVIPDNCAAIASSNNKTNGIKYKAWCDNYVISKYLGKMESNDIYLLRCAMVHQGMLRNDTDRLNKIVFQVPTTGFNLHLNIINGGILLNIEIFCRDIIEGYKVWKEENKTSTLVQENLMKTLHYFPTGEGSFVFGLPTLG